MRAFPPGDEVRRARARVVTATVGVDAYQPLRLRKRQRSQDDGVHDAEDGGRRPDPDGECQRSDCGETGHARELTQRIATVLHDFMYPFSSAHVALPPLADAAAGVVDSLDVAEATDGLRTRQLGVEAARDVLARAHLDVERQLGVDLVGDARLPDERPQLATERALTRHGSRSATCPPLGGEQDARYGAGESRPLFGLGAQLLASDGGQPVELRLASELGLAPFGLDPPFPFHAVQGGIERALFDDELLAAGVFEPARNRIAVAGAPAEGFEHEGVERPVQIFGGNSHGIDYLVRLGSG